MNETEQTISESGREIPLVGDYDVIVCGGGPAGSAAAITSARTGAKTALIELRGSLGGIWTTGLLSYVLDPGNKKGIIVELVENLERIGGKRLEPDVVDQSSIVGRPWVDGSFVYHPESMKLVLDQMVEEAGVSVRFHTAVAAASVETRAVQAIITESKSGREAWRAKVFVDATGDGDLSARAGCSFDIGDPIDGATQPMTLMAIIGGVHISEIGEYSTLTARGAGSPKDRLRELIASGGHETSYSKPSLFRIRDDLFAFMANHEYGKSGIDANDLTAATVDARREIHAIVGALRKAGWDGVYLVATAEQIGVREARRIRGDYTVDRDDLVSGVRHEDAICRATFPVDIHARSKREGGGYSDSGISSKPYDIPLRALIARDMNNLLVAGRCISGDVYAHASYRVTGNAVAMGQAAGVCAALASKSERAAREVPWNSVRDQMSALNLLS